jgi:Gpi18-like mannosyltransferase
MRSTTYADDAASTRRSDLPMLVLAALALVAVAIAARWFFWPRLTLDVKNYNVPWIEHLRLHGFDGLRTSDSNYNAPYLYLQLLAVRLFPGADSFTLVKGIAVALELVLAGAVFLLVRAGDRTRSVAHAGLAALGVLLLPTVVLNASSWGQCDGIYAACVLLALAAADRRREGLWAAGLSSAVGFKLQAAFGGPAALADWWVSRHRVRNALVVVAVYLVWLVPMLLSGRPAAQTLGVYFQQANTTAELALGAPNPWTVLKYGLPGATGYRIGLAVGMTVVLAAIAVFVPLAVRVLREQPERRVELYFTAYFAVPFLLPKMHDRYFFVADVLSFVLAARDRRWVPVAILVQIGSLSAYIAYLDAVRWPRPFGIVANSLVMIFLWRHWRAHRAAAGPLLPNVQAARA